MKRLLPLIAASLLLPMAAFSATPPLTLPQGGTGTSTAPANWFIIGKDTVRLTAKQFIDAATDISGILGVSHGGTGISSTPTYGQLLVGNAGGTYTLTATSSIGLAPATTGTSILKGNGSGGFSSAVNGTDYTLLTANTCSAGNHVSAITAAGSITCSADSGSGSSPIATSTNETAGNLAYWTTTSGTPALLSKVATSSVSNGTGITLSGTGAVVGGGLTITNSSPLSGLTTSFPLSFSNPTLSWIGLATTSQPASSNILVSNGTNGIYGVATSTLTASSPLTGSFTQIGSGGSLGCQTASGSQAGCLSSGDWTTFNGKQAALTFSWPLVNTANTVSFSGLATTSPWTIGQLAYVNSNSLLTSVATSSASCSSGVSCSGFTVVGTVAPSITNSGVLSLAQTYGSAQTGALTIATSSNTTNGITSKLTITNSSGAFTFSSDQSGTLTVGGGGTGQTTFSTSALLYGAGSGAIQTVSTTTPSCGSTLTCSNIVTLTSAAGLPSLTLNLANANTWTATQTFNAGAGNNGILSNALVGIGTTTPKWALTIASSTGPQIALTDTTLTSNIWTIRSVGGNFYLGTSSPSTFATSTNTALSIVPGGISGYFGLASSSPNWLLSLGNNIGINANGTIVPVEQRLSTSTAQTIDWSTTGDSTLYQTGASATTINFINATTSTWAGSRKIINVCNPGSTAGAITWVGAEWAGGSVPTQTTSANQCDVYSCFVTAATSTSASPTWKLFCAASTGFN